MTTLSDRVIAVLRTAVPSLWGALIVWALSLLDWPPAIEQAIIDTITGEAAVALLIAAAVTGWYVLWTRLSPHLPDWLITVVLGYWATPVYSGWTVSELSMLTMETLEAIAADHDIPTSGLDKAVLVKVLSETLGGGKV